MRSDRHQYIATVLCRGNLLRWGLCALVLACVISTSAQSAFDFICRNRNFSASNYCIYPDSVMPVMTAAPPGKYPFHISHYGRHGSRYLSNRNGYDIPYKMLYRADSAGLLTPTGKRALYEVRQIINESEGRWGDLSELGKRQQRHIAQRMVEHFPEVFKGSAYVDAKSTTVNRCILSMGAFVQQLSSLCPQLQISVQASQRDMWYMNHQDKYLRDSMTTSRTKKVYADFSAPRERNPRLMELLFVNPDSATKKGLVDEVKLNYYLLKTGLIQQNTHMDVNTYLLDLFTYEEIHQFWQMENAWWYSTYGPSPFNGGEQPYTQRYLLRKIIEEADSCIRLPQNGAMLRFGHETIVLPLTCLMGINGFDLRVDDLELLEEKNWWACLVFPMASNIQLVFYRSDPYDQDIVFKVLLNEQEASLPLPTDIAPYYHWKDFRSYFLKKLDDYEALRKSRQR